MLGKALKIAASSAKDFFWVGLLGNDGSDERRQRIAVDGSGNLYVACFSDTLTESPYTASSLLVIKLNPTGQIAWQRKLTGPVGFEDNFFGKNIDVDSLGNVYVCAATVDDKGFVAKYNVNGTLQWQKTFQTQKPDTGQTGSGFSALAVTDSHLYVAGKNTYNNNCVMVKYNTDGTVAWSSSLLGAYSDSYDVAIDSVNNPYLATSLVLSGTFSLVAIRFNIFDGTIQWQRGLDSASLVSFGRSICVDENNNIYLAGEGFDDAYVLKVTSGGVFQWQRKISGLDQQSGIAFAQNGQLWVGGNVVIADFDLAFAVLNANGDYQYGRRLASSRSDARPVLQSVGNNIFIGAEFVGNLSDDSLIARIPSDGSLAGTITTNPGFVYEQRTLTTTPATLNFVSPTSTLETHNRIVADVNFTETAANLTVTIANF